ncbi:DNA translocase FtsK [Thalassobacillus devorans]|uniref:DNA translocase FtsK n=1 Tax=Thalassobacillus devorans TaxID=279813 RepID=UPI000490CC3D|nr:DNA translocase FtsK [Thalassobacillus devorans]
MWNQMKKKLKDILANETSEQPMQVDNTLKHKENNDPYVKTKMAYKYPKQGEFRFPVIPDHRSPHQEHKSSRRPVQTPSHEYQANPVKSPDRESAKQRSYTTKKEYTPVHNRKNNDKPKNERRYQKEESSREEVNNIPFQPSEVPSPIYGYHPRVGKSKVIDDTASSERDHRPQAESLSELLARYREDASSHSEIKEIVTPLEEIPVDHGEEKVDEISEEINEEKTFAADQVKQQDSSEEELPKIEEDPVVNSEDYIAASVETPVQDETTDESIKEIKEEETVATENTKDETTQIDENENVEAIVYEQPPEPEEHSDPVEPAEKDTLPKGPASNEEERSKAHAHTHIGKPVEKKEQHKKRNQAKHHSKKGKQSVPFNVIMTPRDKRNKNKETAVKQSEVKIEEKQETDKPAAAYRKPPLHLLDDPIRKRDKDDEQIKHQMELLETTLNHFHVRAKVINAMRGPSVTRFEVQPEPGVKVSKITNLSDDIKLSMAAKAIRIEAPIPGKQAVGIEIPNEKSDLVGLQEIFESPYFTEDPSPLTVALGLDIGGTPIVTNLQKMPHGLIAGATGSGKSVCINTILVSLLYKAHHEEVKFLLIDPKMVELAPYNDLPHLVSPVITDVKAATKALKWAVKEMDDRYEKFVKEGVRDVERYNQKMIKQNRVEEKMPYLVVVIDELADLMMVSPQDVEDAICRLAQKARACGIHLLVATQRPSVDVITGLIKANIPTRIAFSVSSQVDSRTIIDTAGAEKLLGKGDMLFVENGSGQSVRIQGAFVSDDEIERITSHVKKIAPPNFLFEQEELMMQASSEAGEQDELFEEAVSFVIEHNGASASMLQRRFKVGYNRAARLIDHMEEYGIISEQKGSKPRDVLLSKEQVNELFHPSESAELK